MSSSLFGHLVTRLGPEQTENTATEALAYILRESDHARAAMASILQRSVSKPLTSALWITTQEGDDARRIPDMGVWHGGIKVALIEVKFWAELTDNQPGAYLDSLEPEGTLLFVAPDRRLPRLWADLLRRCRDRAVGMPDDQGGGLTTVAVDGRTLAIISWPSLLASLRGAAERGGASRAAADIDQLVGLSEHIDRTEFLPLGSEELDSQRGQRVRDYLSLNRSLSERLRRIEGFGRLPGISWGIDGNVGWWYDVPQRIWVGYFPTMWAQHGVSPLWAKVGSKRDSPPYVDSDEAFRLVSPLVEAARRSEGGSTYVPLELSLGPDRLSVLSDLTDTVCNLVLALGGKISPPVNRASLIQKDDLSPSTEEMDPDTPFTEPGDDVV